MELPTALKALQSVETNSKKLPQSDKQDASQSQSELFAFESDFELILEKLVEMMQSTVDAMQRENLGTTYDPTSDHLELHLSVCRYRCQCAA